MLLSTIVDQRGEGSLTQKKHFEHVCFCLQQLIFLLCQHSELQYLDRHYVTRKGFQLVLSVRDTSPSVYLGCHWHHSHDKMDQAFPPPFLHIVKNWMVGRPENEAILQSVIHQEKWQTVDAQISARSQQTIYNPSKTFMDTISIFKSHFGGWSQRANNLQPIVTSYLPKVQCSQMYSAWLCSIQS